MNFCVLGSGSKGNCTLVEAGTSSLLIDAGFSGKEIERRLAVIDRHPSSLSGILVTHEHNDHISGVGVLSRRYKLPVYLNSGTYKAAEKKLGKLAELRIFTTGESFRLEDVKVHPFAVSHDTADPVGFVVENNDLRLGYCTDTGRVTRLIEYHLRSCHALILEANHDPHMLRSGPYPLYLQQRIQSSGGHLENREALIFANRLAGNGLRHLVLAHLSETNNHPDLVVKEAMRAFPANKDFKVHLADQRTPGPLIDLSAG